MFYLERVKVWNQDKPEIVRIKYKPHAVHRSPGKHTGFSYMITIPKPFAEKMGLDKIGSYVVTTLIEEELNHDGKKKKVYCVVEKLEVK